MAPVERPLEVSGVGLIVAVGVDVDVVELALLELVVRSVVEREVDIEDEVSDVVLGSDEVELDDVLCQSSDNTFSMSVKDGFPVQYSILTLLLLRKRLRIRLC